MESSADNKAQFKKGFLAKTDECAQILENIPSFCG